MNVKRSLFPIQSSPFSTVYDYYYFFHQTDFVGEMNSCVKIAINVLINSDCVTVRSTAVISPTRTVQFVITVCVWTIYSESNEYFLLQLFQIHKHISGNGCGIVITYFFIAMPLQFTKQNAFAWRYCNSSPTFRFQTFLFIM